MATDLWRSAKAVREAWEDLDALIDAFQWHQSKHGNTWLALTTDERRKLLLHRSDRHMIYAAHSISHKWLNQTKKRAADAIVILDELLDLPEAESICIMNALWALIPENSGLPFDPQKARALIKQATPHAKSTPDLWHNIACIELLLGNEEACIDAAEAAKAQGHNLESIRDDAMFRGLFSNPRFAAVFEGMDPPCFRTLDVDDPLTVRNLDLDSIGKSVPTKLKAFTNLEVLDLSGEFRKLPKWLAKLPKLRKLRFWSWTLESIPDEVICMPSLEAIEAYGEQLPEGYRSPALNQLLKSFHKKPVDDAARRVHLALLVGRDLSKMNDAALVEALDSSATKVARAAMDELRKRWKDRSLSLTKGDQLVIVGRIGSDRSVTLERLASLEVKVSRKVGAKTTAIVVGDRHGGKGTAALEGKVPVVLPMHLHAALDKADVRHLSEDGSEAGAQLSEMLVSADESNVVLALEMIKQGGLPEGLLEELLLIAQNKDFGRKARNLAKTLFERHASDETVEVIRAKLRRTSIFASGETKLATRLKAIGKDSELDAEKIARLMLARGATGLKFLLKNAAKGKAKADLLAQMQKGSELTITGRELTRIPDEVSTLKGIRRIDISGNHISRLTSGLFKLTEIEFLDVSQNSIFAIPDEIAALTRLRELDIASNSFSGFPAAVLQLSWLRKLNFSRESYSPRMNIRSLPAELARLSNLEELSLRSHQFKTLPKALLELPKLHTLNIGSGRIDELPAWLVDMPALQTIEVSYLDMKNADDAEKTLKALTDKGVTVKR